MSEATKPWYYNILLCVPIKRSLTPSRSQLRNQWGGTSQEGLWIFCGNFTQCRFYSRATAVLIQIELLGGWDAVRGVIVE